MKSKNIFLIGPRACGKTSVGRGVAQALGLEFVDTDHALVKAVGMEIAEYVQANGWDAFRDREVETLEREASVCGRVVGCGGGIVLRGENRKVLETGFTVYLKATPEELARRLMDDPNEAQRPSLTGKSVVEEIREVLAERAPMYEGCADLVVFENDISSAVERIVSEIDRIH